MPGLQSIDCLQLLCYIRLDNAHAICLQQRLRGRPVHDSNRNQYMQGIDQKNLEFQTVGPIAAAAARGVLTGTPSLSLRLTWLNYPAAYMPENHAGAVSTAGLVAALSLLDL